MMDANGIKQAANGRWQDILANQGMPGDALTGKPGPCPKCGEGRDRFQFTDRDGDGSIFNRCLGCGGQCGDGLATLEWWHDCTFPDALEMAGGKMSPIGDKPERNGHSKPNGKPVAEIAKSYPFPSAEAVFDTYSSQLGMPVAIWRYVDASGVAIAAAARFEPDGQAKEFRQASSDGSGWSNTGAKSGIPLLYLNEIQKAETVFVVEGEKCVDALRAIGLTATTNLGSIGGVAKTDWSPLRDKDLVILPDNDEVGKKYQQAVIQRIGYAKVIDLDGLETKGDVADWIPLQENPHEQLLILLDGAETVEVSSDHQNGYIREWQSATPIPLHRSDLRAIPNDTFNDGFLGPIVREVSQSTETPIELGGFLALAAIATIAAKRFSVLVEPGYYEPLNIWAATAMEPSNRKSSVLKEMAGPLYAWERSQRELLAPEVAEAKSDRKTQERIVSDRRKKISKIVDADERRKEMEEIRTLENDLPPVPSIPQLLVNDCTPESVARLLQDQGERLAFLDSEADSLFAMMMGRYSDNPVLDVYLKSYSGDYVKVDRQTREPINLHQPLMTLGIAPQPGLIQDLVNKPVLVKRGLLSRFMFLLPVSKVGSRSLNPSKVSVAARQRYEIGLLYLLGIPPNLDGDDVEIPYVIRFTDAGYRVWKDWQREIEPMMKPEGRLADDALKYWGGKLAGNTARLAALLHIAISAPTQRPDEVEISASTVKRAVEVARIMIDHSIAVHDLAATSPSRSRASKILAWLARNPRDKISVRELHQRLRGRADFRSAKDVRDGLNVLVEHGWLLAESVMAKAGRPSEPFFVHPEIHTQNTQNLPIA